MYQRGKEGVFKRKYLGLFIIVLLIAVGISVFFISKTIIENRKIARGELSLGVGIEQFVISDDTKTAYIKLAGESEREIKSVKFIFKDSEGKEYVYETTEGAKEILEKSVYNYEISSDKIGLDFDKIKEVSVIFDYAVGDEVKETPISKPAPKKIVSGGGGGGGGGGPGPTPCTPESSVQTCGNWVCGSKTNNCGAEVNCGSCNANNEICSEDGQCILRKISNATGYIIKNKIARSYSKIFETYYGGNFDNFGSTVIKNDVGYIASKNWTGGGKATENITAFNAINGSIIWSTNFGSSDGTPLIDGNFIYINSMQKARQGGVYKLNITDGTILAENHICTDSAQSIAMSDDLIFDACTNPGGGLYAYNKNNLNVNWSFSGADGVTTPLYYNGRVVYGDSSGMFFQLNATNGDILWSVNFATGFFDIQPSYKDGIVYASSSSVTKAINWITGDVIWSNSLGNSYAQHAIHNNKLWVSLGAVGKMMALDISDGSVICSYQTKRERFFTSINNIYQGPSISNGLVFFGSRNYYLYALNESNCELVWKVNIGEDIVSAPAISNGKLYVNVDDGYVHAFDLGSGSEEWSYLGHNSNGISYCENCLTADKYIELNCTDVSNHNTTCIITNYYSYDINFTIAHENIGNWYNSTEVLSSNSRNTTFMINSLDSKTVVFEDLAGKSTCGLLDEEGSTYELSQNLIPTRECLSVVSPNIRIDCKDYYILNSTLFANGIYSFQSNTTIANCNITMRKLGINIAIHLDSGSDNSSVFNTTLNSNSIAIRIRSNNVILKSINSYLSTIGIIFASHNLTVYDSNFSSGSIINQGFDMTLINSSYGTETLASTATLFRKWYYRAYVSDSVTETPLSSEKVTNGDFNGGGWATTGDWTAATLATYRVSFDGTPPAPSPSTLEQSVPIEVGKKYQLQFNVISWTATSMDFDAKIGGYITGPISSTGIKTYTFTATNTDNLRFTARAVSCPGPPGYTCLIEMDDVSVKEIGSDIVTETPLSGINVKAYDIFNNNQFNLITDDTGYTEQTEIINYANNGGVKTYYSPYTIYAGNVGSQIISHVYDAVQNNIDEFVLEGYLPTIKPATIAIIVIIIIAAVLIILIAKKKKNR